MRINEIITKAGGPDNSDRRNFLRAALTRLAGLVQKGGKKLYQVGEPPKSQALSATKKPDLKPKQQ
jgi:hypothetical protein